MTRLDATRKGEVRPDLFVSKLFDEYVDRYTDRKRSRPTSNSLDYNLKEELPSGVKLPPAAALAIPPPTTGPFPSRLQHERLVKQQQAQQQPMGQISFRELFSNKEVKEDK